MAVTSKLKQMLIERAHILRQPVMVTMELLPVCNLECRMCYIRSSMQEVNENGGLKNADDWIAIAEQMKDAETMFILLTGGEVFMYPEFRRLYETLYRMGFSLRINTNATLIDEDAALWLRKHPPQCVSISLYGASDETYEAICGRKGVFTKVDHAIGLLLNNHIRVELKTMLTPLNVHDLKACMKYARERNVFFEPSWYAFPPERQIGCENQIRLNPQEAVRTKFDYRHLSYTVQQYDEYVVRHLRKLEETRDRPGCDLCGFTCGASNSNCWITWQGHMTPCAMLNDPYTLPFEQGFLPAWEELKRKSDVIRMSPQCSHCEKSEVCTVCAAANYAETGSFEKASPFHCSMTDLTLEEMRRYAKERGLEDRIIKREQKNET